MGNSSPQPAFQVLLGELQWLWLVRLISRGISARSEILFTTDTRAPCLK